MPSDELSRKALEALATKTGRFRTAITLTADQLRGRIAEHNAATRGGNASAAVLGQFAAARIDAARFSQILAPQKPHDAAWTAVIERALAVLDDLASRGDAIFQVKVERGGDLVAAVDRALATVGRAFGAARIANLVDSSRYRPEEHDALLNTFPFRSWSRDERRMAPPLVIEVAGGDLAASGLAAYLDGNEVLVLLAEGQAPAAPLARLISPGVYVAQTDSEETLAGLAELAGPAVIAILPSESARFTQTPAGGLEVTHLPAQEPRRALGSLSVFQQQQDLRVLVALAAPASAAPVEASAVAAPSPAPVGGAAAAVDPVGTLAAWLLARVDLSDLETAAT